ncbi:MAG: TonB family protein [Betaproteobacteria bacterium]|jgi:protein TonB|nr:TonB family protein [Betaproteobacteria bacterium]
MAISQSPRVDLPVAAPDSNAPLWWALAGSIALHIFVLSLPGMPLRPLAPLPEERGAALTARLELAPPPPVEKPPPPLPEEKPAAPPTVLKNTIDPPQAEVLKDPIEPKPKPKPKPRPEPRAEKPKPKPKPKPEPKPAESKPPRTETAAIDEPRQGLDLRLPEHLRGGIGLRTPPSTPAEQLSPNELRETLGRLSETMLFPPEALERGLEGEVTLLVQVGEGGRILDASIASGSGHKILDDAAIRAVLKLGTLGPSSANRTILLPVRFRIL